MCNTDNGDEGGVCVIRHKHRVSIINISASEPQVNPPVILIQHYEQLSTSCMHYQILWGDISDIPNKDTQNLHDRRPRT